MTAPQQVEAPRAGVWGRDSWACPEPSRTAALRGEDFQSGDEKKKAFKDNTAGPSAVPDHLWCSFNVLLHLPEGGINTEPSAQFSRSIVSDYLPPHGLQHTRPPCPSPTPGVYPNSCPSSQWCHPTISSSVVPFSSCLQFFPASGSFLMSQLFASGGQSIGVSASASVLLMNIQDWSPLGWTGWISLQSKALSRGFSNTTVQKHQFFSTQLSSQSNSHIHTWPLEKPQPWLDRPLLTK